MRAKRAIAALRQLAAPTAAVVRDGPPLAVPAAECVRGDLVRLETGARAPAGRRLVQATALRVAALACLANDAPLTGGGDPTDRAFLDAAAAAGLAVRAASRQ